MSETKKPLTYGYALLVHPRRESQTIGEVKNRIMSRHSDISVIVACDDSQIHPEDAVLIKLDPDSEFAEWFHEGRLP